MIDRNERAITPRPLAASGRAPHRSSAIRSEEPGNGESGMPFTLGEAARSLGLKGFYHLSDRLSLVSTDTRTIEPGALFVALKGVRFDGHHFVKKARERGAAAAVVLRGAETPGVPPGFPLLRVNDTVHALGAIAHAYRRKSSSQFLALSGSNGKTTAKTFVASLLENFGKAHRSPLSFNNHIGVPLTILSSRPRQDWVVLEMGTNHFGELSYLASVAEPEIAAITNIGDTHLEFLEDRQGVARAKAELLEALPDHGTAVLNGDDQFFDFLRGRTNARIVTFGMQPGLSVFATDVRRVPEGWEFRVNGEFPARLRVPGRFNISNALAALGIGRACGLDLPAMAECVTQFHLPEQRMEVTRAGSLTLVFDAYNANPSSMVLALEEFRGWPARGRRIVVLGEMRELGRASDQMHARLGEEAARKNFDHLVCVGAEAGRLAAAAARAGMPRDRLCHFENSPAASRALLPLLEENDTVFFKGSHGVALETVQQEIRTHFEEEEDN